MKLAIFIPAHPLNEAGDYGRLALFADMVDSLKAQESDDWRAYIIGQPGPWMECASDPRVVEIEFVKPDVMYGSKGGIVTIDKGYKIKAGIRVCLEEGYNPDWICRLDDDDWINSTLFSEFKDDGQHNGWMSDWNLFYDAGQWAKGRNRGTLSPNTTLLRGRVLEDLHMPHHHFLEYGQPMGRYHKHLFCRVLHGDSWSGSTLASGQQVLNSEGVDHVELIDGPPEGFICPSL